MTGLARSAALASQIALAGCQTHGRDREQQETQTRQSSAATWLPLKARRLEMVPSVRWSLVSCECHHEGSNLLSTGGIPILVERTREP